MNDRNDIEKAREKLRLKFPKGIRLFDSSAYNLDQLLDQILNKAQPELQQKYHMVEREQILLGAFEKIDEHENKHLSSIELLATLLFSTHLLNTYCVTTKKQPRKSWWRLRPQRT